MTQDVLSYGCAVHIKEIHSTNCLPLRPACHHVILMPRLSARRPVQLLPHMEGGHAPEANRAIRAAGDESLAVGAKGNVIDLPAMPGEGFPPLHGL